MKTNCLKHAVSTCLRCLLLSSASQPSAVYPHELRFSSPFRLAQFFVSRFLITPLHHTYLHHSTNDVPLPASGGLFLRACGPEYHHTATSLLSFVTAIIVIIIIIALCRHTGIPSCLRRPLFHTSTVSLFCLIFSASHSAFCFSEAFVGRSSARDGRIALPWAFRSFDLILVSLHSSVLCFVS